MRDPRSTSTITEHNHRSGRSRRRAALLAVPALLVIAMTTGAGPAEARPTGTDSAGVTEATDSPGKHVHGLITVGMPERKVAGVKRAGAIDVYPPHSARQVLTEKSLGLKSTAGARFGASITMADLNHDQLTDLLIGVPGSPAKEDSGHVVIVFQSDSGLFTAAHTRVLQGPGVSGDEFGAAVAVSSRTADGWRQDVWVGAPGLDLSTGPSQTIGAAGAVYHFVNDIDGTVTAAGRVIEGDSTVPGPAEADDRFGSVLAPTTNGVVVGVPTKDVDGVIDAGEIVRVRLDRDTHQLLPAQVISENTPGVPGTAQESARFGAAVSENGYGVGIPGEQVGSQRAAGAVQTFIDDPAQAGRLLPSVQFTQDSPGIPGKAQTGDHFGLALSQNILACVGVLSLAIGSPGEDVDLANNAGSVTLVTIRPNSEASQPCPAKRLTQGNGLPGKAESGDRLGTTVSTIGGINQEEATQDTLLVGTPGEDAGTHRNAGRAAIRSMRAHLQGFGAQSGDATARSYGSVLGTEASGL
jgi:hypothetical protein